jgi:hypothetical protein
MKGEGLIMKYLSDRYAKVYTHNGIDICTLKSACPEEGDELGYKIDHQYFDGCTYQHVEYAIKAIDLVLKNSKDI